MVKMIFFSKFLEDISPFCGATDTTCFGLLVTFAIGFKARVDPLACMLCCLHATESSDSPLVWHLLTSWLLSRSHPCTCEQALDWDLLGVQCSPGRRSTDWAMNLIFVSVEQIKDNSNSWELNKGFQGSCHNPIWVYITPEFHNP